MDSLWHQMPQKPTEPGVDSINRLSAYILGCRLLVCLTMVCGCFLDQTAQGSSVAAMHPLMLFRALCSSRGTSLIGKCGRAAPGACADGLARAVGVAAGALPGLSQHGPCQVLGQPPHGWLLLIVVLLPAGVVNIHMQPSQYWYDEDISKRGRL